MTQPDGMTLRPSDVETAGQLTAVAAAIAGHHAALRELTAERDELVRQMRSRCYTYREIAALAGISYVSVGNILKAATGA